MLNPKGGEGGPKVPAGQEIVCHFSQDHAMVTKNLDFIHKHTVNDYRHCIGTV